MPVELKPGYYTVELNRTVWAIPDYYENLTPVGTGAYGTCLVPFNLLFMHEELIGS
uniref:Serine/threonine protein kinase n=1 Tax=Heterorhabditis bacteriophora TaxID=37862 RepID=A0A1I7XA40_HETBA